MIDDIPPGVTTDALNDAVNFLSEDINSLSTNVDTAIATTAINPTTVNSLGEEVSDPPTQAEVQAIFDKVNELIAALTRT